MNRPIETTDRSNSIRSSSDDYDLFSKVSQEDEKGNHRRDDPLYVKRLLHLAIQNDNMTNVELLVRRGADVNFKSEGLTPLHLAIRWNRVQIVEYLVTNGASIHSKCFIDSQRCTPLNLAIEMGHRIIVKLLLKNGAEIDDTLRLAFSNKHQPIIAAFIYIWSLVHLSPNDRSKLLDAIDDSEDQYRQIFQHLLKDGEYDEYFMSNSSDSMTMLSWLIHEAVKMDCTIIVGYLVNFTRFDVNAPTAHSPLLNYGRTLLHSAIEQSGIDTIEYLIRHVGSDINAIDDYGRTPLYDAISITDAKIVKLLICCGANIMNNQRRYLWEAIVSANDEIVEMLLEHYRDLDVNAEDENGVTALDLAISICYRYNGLFNDTCIKIVKLLLNRGASVDARGVMDSRPLHTAAEIGSVESVESLLAHNADINVRRSDGETPLHVCVQQCDSLRIEAVVKLLLASNANVNEKNNNEWTALHYASQRQMPHIAEVLLMNGAEINAKDLRGNTPLHLVSTYHGNLQSIIEVLLRFGSDINAINDHGMTPLRQIIELHRESLNVYRIVYEEIIKRRLSNLYLCEQNLKYFVESTNDEFDDFEDCCKREIVAMRRSKITLNVSFYDILTKDANDVSIYANFGKIVENLQSKKWMVGFPIYCHLIFNSFKKAQIRHPLIDPSFDSFDTLIGYEFYDFLTIKIFRYLRDEDLENLIKADQNNRTSCCFCGSGSGGTGEELTNDDYDVATRSHQSRKRHIPMIPPSCCTPRRTHKRQRN